MKTDQNKAGLCFLILLPCFLLLQSLTLIESVSVENIFIEINKNVKFKGNSLETLYSAKCTKRKEKEVRVFEIIKTDRKLKNFFMVEFVLIEKVTAIQNIYYPVGWENSKVSSDELKSYCLSILKGKIPPININE
jgi:hypothetical protein